MGWVLLKNSVFYIICWRCICFFPFIVLVLINHHIEVSICGNKLETGNSEYIYIYILKIIVNHEFM